MQLEFERIEKAYKEQFGFDLLVTDAHGAILKGPECRTDCDCANASDERRIRAAEQTRYWGNTIINLCCDTGYALWAVPLMDNNRITGALLTQAVELEGKDQDFHKLIQNAANYLLKTAVEANLINEAELELARQRTLAESDRFLAIEASKDNLISDDLRSLYLGEEPSLLTAIKEGRTNEARSILNRILTGIYGVAGDRIELLKSCILELIVMMSRAAVEAGAEPSSVLGRNYHSLAELSAIDDEEELSTWLRRMLDTLIEGIHRNDQYPHSLLMLKAISHMQNNLHMHLRRDDVARIAGVSPSHFSKLVTERMGRSFTSLLAQMRINRAKEFLSTTDRSLTDIALSCGFCDQSHLNKVFRSLVNSSPGEYRKKASNPN